MIIPTKFGKGMEEKFSGQGRIIPKVSFIAYSLWSEIYLIFILFNHIEIFMKERCKSLRQKMTRNILKHEGHIFPKILLNFQYCF